MDIALQPKQVELLRLIESSDYEWLGFGGARGGAKSHAIRKFGIYLGFKYNAKTLIFRRYRQELLDNHVYPLFMEHPELRPFFNKSEMILFSPDGTPFLQFGYADQEDDIYRFQGKEYTYVFVDEATQSTQKMIEFLRTSNRDKNTGGSGKMILTMNPGGVGHSYIKRIFIDKIYTDNEDPSKYSFLQSSVWDNVFWVRKQLEKDKYTVEDYYSWSDKARMEYCISHSSYAQSLGALPEDLKKAYLFGDWDVFGGMFFKGFDKSKQVIEPFEIPAGWTLRGSLDPGFSSPLSFGLQARDFAGNIYRIATYYQIDTIPNHAENIEWFLTSPESPVYPYLKGRKPDFVSAGHDAFYKLDRNAIISNDWTVEDFFRRRNIVLVKAFTDRIPGWWRWKSLIPDHYFIFDKLNKPLIEQMTAVESDQKNPEDISGRGNDIKVEDHALDEARYGLTSIFKPFAKKTEEPVARPFIRDMENEITETSF